MSRMKRWIFGYVSAFLGLTQGPVSMSKPAVTVLVVRRKMVVQIKAGAFGRMIEHCHAARTGPSTTIRIPVGCTVKPPSRSQPPPSARTWRLFKTPDSSPMRGHPTNDTIILGLRKG